MGNQVYSFRGKTYLQGEHGSIGDEAVGMIASLVMIWWSRRLKLKLKELKIENDLMKIFVDDLNGVFSSLPKGTEYIDGKLMFSEKKAEEDKDLPDDQVTMNVIKDIANNIEDMIVMTADYPSNHKVNRVPMLDVEVWINEEDNLIYYSFYEKETKSPYVISKMSAMPISKKIECLGQEVF